MEVVGKGAPNFPSRGILNLVLVVPPSFPGFQKKCNGGPHPETILEWIRA
jgi:hypothetical protein